METLFDINLNNYENHLLLANKLLHDKDNTETIYSILYEFISSNKILVFNFIIENKLILLEKCFIDVLYVSFDQSTINKSQILTSIEKGNFEEFLELIINEEVNIPNYFRLAQEAVKYDRKEFLEIILATIKLEIDMIEDLISISTNKEIIELIYFSSPDIALNHYQKESSTDLSKVKIFDDYKPIPPIKIEEEFFEAYKISNIEKFKKIYKKYKISYELLKGIYFGAIIDGRNDVFKILYKDPSLSNDQEQALQYAFEHNNQFVLEEIKKFLKLSVENDYFSD